MPGPPKKPTSLKLVEGTYREDRVARDEPRPRVAIPKPPKHLAGIALEEWHRIVQELADNGLMTNLDRAALVLYCDMWAKYIKAEENVKKNGMTLMTQANNMIENPYFSIMKRCAELMHKFLVEFGMTPASRTRISAPLSKVKEGKNDDEEKYFG